MWAAVRVQLTELTSLPVSSKQVYKPDLPRKQKGLKKKESKLSKVLETAWRRRQWHPTLILLPGKSHGQRSLVGCSPWGRTELDKTEVT